MTNETVPNSTPLDRIHLAYDPALLRTTGQRLVE